MGFGWDEDLEYDEYVEGLETGHWTMKSGRRIRPEDMTVGHLQNTKRLCERLAKIATFTSEAEKWEEWAEIFESELAVRCEQGGVKFTHENAKPPKRPTRGKKAPMVCHCGQEYQAREADLKRGWAQSCSKSCAAIRRDFGRRPAKRKQ